MPLRSLSRRHRACTLVLLVSVLIMRIICFALRMTAGDCLGVIGSGVYYVLLAAFCFFTGRVKNSAYILSVAFLCELLLITLCSFLTALSWVGGFLVSSHFSIMSLLRSLERVVFEYDCYTFPDWIYAGCVALVYILMIAVNLIGKKLKNKL